MIQKLTANLKKSQQYGKKIAEDLSSIASQILQNRIDIVNLQSKIDSAIKQEQSISMAVKRQDEQSSNYDYKLQKMEIRLKEHNRKLVLQQEIYGNKLAHHEVLAKKVEVLQSEISQQSNHDSQISLNKKVIEQAELKLNKQAIAIDNLYQELMNKSKQMRGNEDELQMRKKANKKKRDNLEYIQNLIKGCGEDKENMCTNGQGKEGDQDRLQHLQRRKGEINKYISEQTDILINFCQQFEALSEITTNLKKQLNKDWQLAQQIKAQKNTLWKLQQSMSALP